MTVINDSSGAEQEKDDVDPVVVVGVAHEKVQEADPERPERVGATTMVTEEGSTSPADRENDSTDQTEKGGTNNADREQVNEKCTIEVFSTEIVGRPPPDYSLTSPCLPPNSPRKQDWPPEPPPPFDGHPPYPAGLPLLKVAYPKDIPGPTYACPKCEGRFLYHRRSGIVQCPFCHSEISIGRYTRKRGWLWLIFGLVMLLSSLNAVNISLAEKTKPFPSYIYFIAAACFLFSAVISLFRSTHMFRYPETDRIEFT